MQAEGVICGNFYIDLGMIHFVDEIKKFNAIMDGDVYG